MCHARCKHPTGFKCCHLTTHFIFFILSTQPETITYFLLAILAMYSFYNQEEYISEQAHKLVLWINCISYFPPWFPFLHFLVCPALFWPHANLFVCLCTWQKNVLAETFALLYYSCIWYTNKYSNVLLPDGFCGELEFNEPHERIMDSWTGIEDTLRYSKI